MSSFKWTRKASKQLSSLFIIYQFNQLNLVGKDNNLYYDIKTKGIYIHLWNMNVKSANKQF